jgi:DNA-binding NarL/FixJ family response regulator
MLTNIRALIIEEEALLALDIEDILARRGLADIRWYRSVAEATPHFAELSTFGLAVIEARLGAANVVAFTERLAKAGVAVVVMSADHTAADFFPHAVALDKPFDAAGLLAACDAAKARAS